MEPTDLSFKLYNYLQKAVQQVSHNAKQKQGTKPGKGYYTFFEQTEKIKGFLILKNNISYPSQELQGKNRSMMA